MNLEQEIKKFERICYQPIVEKSNDLNYPSSKYYGNPWIENGKEWPSYKNGNYYTFVYQLDIATLPPEFQKELKRTTGIIQFFSALDDFEIRVVEPNENGRYMEQPISKNENLNYKINDENPQQLIIKEWKPRTDYPAYLYDSPCGLESLWEEIEEHPDFDIDKYYPFLGDKLGGYTYSPQGGSSSDGLLYQIQFDTYDEDSADERTLPSYAPELIAGDGTGHLSICEEDATGFDFYWECG